MTPTLPRDIWLHIAQYLPALFLCDLISVNSVLFEIGMDCRYRQMSFAYLDNRMLRSLARLKDPAVAKRVRILHVYPGFLQEALDKETPTTQCHSSSSSSLLRSLKDRLADLSSLLLIDSQRLFPFPFPHFIHTHPIHTHKHPKFKLIRSLKRTSDIVQIMLQVLGGLPNVTDYHVTWCGLPSIGATAVPFLASVFTSNSSLTLRKVSLELSLDNVKDLLTPTSLKVETLEELALVLHCGSLTYTCSGKEILRNYLAPAIAGVGKSLKTLTIQSWEETDLSPMFFSIAPLPSLETFTIAIPVESSHLGDPLALSFFLNNHKATLKTLLLRATQYGGRGLTPNLVSFDKWVREALEGVHLPKLKRLDVSSGMFPVDTSLKCLEVFKGSLTDVSLTGVYRSFEDVEHLLRVLSPTLAKLRLGPVSLTPQLVDLLASRLEGLQRLELVVRYILPNLVDMPMFQNHTVDLTEEGQRPSQIDKFITEMNPRTYPSWSLSHLSILAEWLPFRTYYEGLLEQTFVQCVPSVRRYR